MMTAYPNRTSPVVRGAWILDRLLGTPPSDPPLEVPSLPENRRGQPAQTLRARLEQHREKATCFACHGVMDPLGFALENFNAVGQFRANDPDTLTPIDTAGQLPDGTAITGPDDLRRALVDRPDHQFVQAFTENLMTYALGRSLDYRDMPTVRRIVRQAAADDYRFKSIVLGVISSDAFRKREAELRRPEPSCASSSEASVNPDRRTPVMFLSQKAPVTAHRPQRRRRDHRAPVAGCHDPGRNGAGADGRRSQPASGLRVLSPWRAPGGMDADPDRPRFRFSVHPQAAGTDARARDRRQRSAQQGWGELQPARHHRRDLAELRQPALAQCEDRCRGDGRSDRRTASRQRDLAAVAGTLRRAGRHDLVPNAGSAAADGEQSAEGVLRHVRPGRYERRTPGHSQDDGQPARLREGIDGQPEPQARCG